MNDKNGSLAYNKEETKAAIYRALEGRSDKFKAIVLELAIANRWNIKDPIFMIQLATGQMEALLQQYPSEFAVLLTKILEDAEVRWEAMQAGFIKSIKLAEMTSQTFEGYVGKVEAATDEQIKRLEAESEQLIAKGFALSQAHTLKQIEKIAKGTQRIHYVKAAGYSAVAAFLLAGMSWTGGWLGHSWTKDASAWGRIEQWNQEELDACLEAGRSTCNFHIKSPEEVAQSE